MGSAAATAAVTIRTFPLELWEYDVARLRRGSFPHHTRSIRPIYAELLQAHQSGDECWLYVQEPWATGKCPCAATPLLCRCRSAVGPADAESIEEMYEVTFLADRLDEDDSDRSGPWQPASTLPEWAATIWLRVSSVRPASCGGHDIRWDRVEVRRG